jgi:uncharacterized protein (DUF1330 family)
MKTYYTVALSMLVGAGLGGTAMQAIHAQAKPPIYYISEIDVTNPDAYPKDYGTKMQAVVKSHGGRQLAIGGVGGANAKTLTTLEGTPPKGAVLQVWDSMEKLQAWRNDPQFKELRTAGEKYATWRSFAIEGQQ